MTPRALRRIEVLTCIVFGTMVAAFWGNLVAAFMASGAFGFAFVRIARARSVAFAPGRSVRRAGQALVGLAIGFALTRADGHEILGDLPLFIASAFALIAVSIGIGLAYARLARVDVMAALMATMPGGLAVMSSIAADYDTDIAVVALTQALRMGFIVISAVLLDVFLHGAAGPSVRHDLALAIVPAAVAPLVAVLLATYGSVVVAVRLKVPVGQLFGPMIVGFLAGELAGAAARSGWPAFAMPPIVTLMGQILLGLAIGENLGARFTLTRAQAGYALLSAGMTVVSGAVLGAGIFFVTRWDWVTCFIVAAPGGAAEMIALSIAFGRHPEIVTAGHAVRQLAVNALLPAWIALFVRLDAVFSPGPLPGQTKS